MLNPSKLLDYRLLGAIGLALSLACAGTDKDTEETGDTGSAHSGGNGGDSVEEPAIEVSPARLDFGEGGEAVQTFSISNVGAVELAVDAITLDRGLSYTLTTPGEGPPYTMAPGGHINITVTWGGDPEGNNTDVVTVDSNDPDSPHATVDLYGPGSGGTLTLDPNQWNAGSVAVGGTTSTTIDLVASGGAVTIDELSVTGTGFTGEWSDSFPTVLPSGERMEVLVRFSPPSTSEYSGRLVVGTADGNVTALLSGVGAEEGGPVAVCSVDPGEVTVPDEDAVFSGTESYDTSGASITSYAWTLVSKPAGSTATLPGGSAATRNFTPDIEGSYVAELMVTNSRGDRSDVCETTLEAVAPASGGLDIVLTWSAADDDMDLHFLRPGGSLESDDDCYYANTNPDWGSSRSTLDNPELVADDITGTGPEEIVLDTMGDVGDYEVWVDDYTGSTGDTPANNNVTVEIYSGGRLVYTDTKSCARECADLHFADIDSATGRITGY